MAQSEDVLWEILGLMRNHTTGWTSNIVGHEQHTEIKNGYAVSRLKAVLVLKFLPGDIEDTIYFMKHREYLITHGQGIIMPELVYSLTDKAISVCDSQTLPDDEKEAFKESLWKIEPKFYGIGPNLKAWKKKIFEWKKKIQK